MNNALLLVKILKSLGDLRNNVAGKFFAEIGESDNLVEEFAAGGELEHDIVILLSFSEIDELDDVGMVELTHYLHLLEYVGSLHDGSAIVLVSSSFI